MTQIRILLIFLFSTIAIKSYSQCSPACTLNNIGVSRWWGDGDNQNSIPDATNDDEDGDDFIAFKNYGTTNVDISGWQLYTDRANQAGINPVFTFPSGTILSPGQTTVVVAQWNGPGVADNATPALPNLWFDADFHTGGEGLFDETALNYAHLRNPSANQYITISLRGTSTIPNFPAGTQVCETNVRAVVNDQDFNGCEQVVWNSNTCNYTLTTNCDVPDFNEPCSSITNMNPELSNYNVRNSCTSSTVNLNDLHTLPIPSGTTLVWYTNPNHSGVAYPTPNNATAGVYYAFYFNSTNNCYSLASLPVTVQINILDSDGDGIFDTCDLDDDNDGILDINEECRGFLAQNQDGAWLGKTTSGLSVSAPSMTSQTAVSNLNDGQINYWANQNGGGARISQQSASSHSITYTFSTPVPAYEIAFLIFDADPSIASGSLNVEYTFLVNGSPSNDFISVSRGNTRPTLVYNSSTGKINLSSTANDHEILLKGIATTLVSTITLTSINTGAGDSIGYSLFAYAQCDTDGDGISNHLDLDSDNDGCVDAIEGGALLTSSNLVTAGGSVTVGFGSTASNQNLCATPYTGTASDCVGSTGIPILVNQTTGQTVGDSQDSTRNDCIPPFTCSNLAYQVSRPAVGNSSLYSYDVSLGSLNLISPLGFRANAIGYSIIDNTLWGYNSTDKKVARIGANGVSTSYTIPNLPTGFDFNVGTVSPDGYLFLYYSGNARYYVVDVSPLRSTYLQLVDPSTSFSLETSNFGTSLSNSIQVSDWAYNSNNNLLYGIIDPTHTNQLKIVTINPLSGNVSFSSTQVSGAGIELETTGYGSIFTDANFQSLYLFASTLGSFFKIDIATNIATLLSTPGPSTNNDGANCPTTNLITYCYKPAILDTGNTFPTKHGITALGRAGAENENWPMIKQSAWTVLESKEKGFVVNRVLTTAGLANITNPVEGMMVYDEQEDCLKIYTLKSGDTVMGWYCFTTPACPD